jgi:isopropylmalate/homocitrate/citramalate synthase
MKMPDYPKSVVIEEQGLRDGLQSEAKVEDLAFMLQQMGIETGIDIDKIAEISRSLEDFFGKRFAGKMHRVLAGDDIELIRSYIKLRQPD